MAKMQKADVGKPRPLLREAKTPSKRALTFWPEPWQLFNNLKGVANEMATVLMHLATDWPICCRFKMTMTGVEPKHREMQKANVGEPRPLLRVARA